MRTNQKFKPGELVKVCVCQKESSPEGFATLDFHPSPKCGVIYEYINIASYPSSRDFLGRPTAIKENQEVVILSLVGRPFRFKSDDRWELYDVYEILVEGYICHIFSYNLEKIHD
ncbi:hypothetical protein OAA09_00835 [bacterium]|nr:hypothetical protein [bacterium]